MRASSKEDEMRTSLTGAIGGILAVVMSWMVNHSILWCIIHFFCGWLYVIYWILAKTAIYDWLLSTVR